MQYDPVTLLPSFLHPFALVTADLGVLVNSKIIFMRQTHFKNISELWFNFFYSDLEVG